ncbi:hypothetical protein PS2_028180 [Malus domestica]
MPGFYLLVESTRPSIDWKAGILKSWKNQLAKRTTAELGCPSRRQPSDSLTVLEEDAVENEARKYVRLLTYSLMAMHSGNGLFMH